MSNGRLERVFSKSNRSSLSEDRLDHLVRITVEGPPIAQWDATGAVQLWWKSKQHSQVQDIVIVMHQHRHVLISQKPIRTTVLT